MYRAKALAQAGRGFYLNLTHPVPLNESYEARLARQYLEQFKMCYKHYVVESIRVTQFLQEFKFTVLMDFIYAPDEETMFTVTRKPNAEYPRPLHEPRHALLARTPVREIDLDDLTEEEEEELRKNSFEANEQREEQKLLDELEKEAASKKETELRMFVSYDLNNPINSNLPEISPLPENDTFSEKENTLNETTVSDQIPLKKESITGINGDELPLPMDVFAREWKKLKDK
jgi:hypothetical protein